VLTEEHFALTAFDSFREEAEAIDISKPWAELSMIANANVPVF
jgi:hypothetical protein